MQRWKIGEEIRFDGSIHPLVAALPFYSTVPKDPIEHYQWRIDLYERCLVDADFRQGIWEACSQDFLFFVNAFCWIIEPRDETGDSLLPFNTWANQDPVMAALAHYAGKRRDICGDKSRAQGASWMVVALFVWILLFRRRKVLGAMSKDEQTADDYNDPNSLGWKIDFILRNLPPWMVPAGLEVGGPYRNTTHHTWKNPLTDTTIKLFAANKTSGRGGRFTIFFFDEAGSFGANRFLDALSNLQHTCNNRIVLSTPSGLPDEFSRLIQLPSIWLKIILDWEDNPSQNQGKYTSEDGKLKVLDESYKFPLDYDFVLDGIMRSPWFDNECARANHNMIEINRELRRCHGGARARPFPDEALSRMRRYCQEPKARGRIFYNPADLSDMETLKFASGSGVELELWFQLDEQGLPPFGEYVVGCDPAAGTASDTSSNAVVSVFNGLGQQVAQLASNRINPTELAQHAIALCYWFGRGEAKPFLNWDKVGPLGTQFSREVKRQAYPHVYIDVDPDKRGAKRNGKPGFHASKTSMALIPLCGAMINSQIEIRSESLINECAEYVFDGDDWKHPGVRMAKDQADAHFNHGDRAVGAGIAVISLIDRRLLPDMKARRKQKPTLASAPKYSGAWRERQSKLHRRNRQRQTSCVW